MSQEIKANIVIEMMGRPKDHIVSVMDQFLERMNSEKGVSIVNKKVHDPKIVEQKNNEGKIIEFPKGKELFSTFSELELGFETVLDLVRVVFVYMPSHVEIISPRKIELENFDLGTVLTEITRKLHQYDAIAKNAMMQNQMLAKKLQEMGVEGVGGFKEKIEKEKVDEKKKTGKKKSKDKVKSKKTNKK